MGTLAQIMRLSLTPQGAQVLVGGRRVMIDQVIQAPSSGGHVLEVKEKEAADEAGQTRRAFRRQGLRDRSDADQGDPQAQPVL